MPTGRNQTDRASVCTAPRVINIKSMDYKGQELAETVYQIIITVFGIVGWFVGYVKGDLTHGFHVWCVGVAIACAVAIPSWPCFNRNPIKWLDEIPKRPSGRRKKKSGRS